MKQSLIILLSLVMFQPLLASESVIYGDDNRRDVFEENDPQLLQMARTVVAILPGYAVEDRGDVIVPDQSTFGQMRQLCSEERFKEQISPAYCTGFLVSPDMIATAGHCVSSNMRCGQDYFVFDFALFSASDSFQEISKENVYHCKNIHKRVYEYNGADFALIQLDRKVRDRSPAKLRESGVLSSQDELVMIGHPSGLPTKIADGGFKRSTTVNDKYFVANLDAYGGNSGSPVFNKLTGEVEGILVRGAADFIWDSARSCNASHHCENDECSGESSTLTSTFKDFVR